MPDHGRIAAFGYMNTAPLHTFLQHNGLGDALKTGALAANLMHLRMYGRFRFAVREESHLLWASDRHAPDETEAVKRAI